MKEQFIAEIKLLSFPEIEIKETCETVEVIIFPFKEEARLPVVKLINKYVGFWKSIGITVKHSRNPDKAHWIIPYHMITGEDFSDEQFLNICNNIGKRIIVPKD